MRVLTVTLVVFLLTSCGGPALKPSITLPPEGTPAAIVVDTEIKGTILGKALKRPSGIAADERGNLYLVDAGNNRVIKFDPSFKPLVDRGGYGNQEGQFNQPRFVTVDNILAVLVSDAGNRRIERLDLELNYVDQYRLNDETDPLKYGAPSGVATTKYGAVWIADHDKNRLIILDNVGSFDKMAANYGATGGDLDRPEKLLSDDEDNFYVCDPGHARIAVYNSYGQFEKDIKDDDLLWPASATFDSRGFLWVFDLQSARIFCFSPEGTKLTEQGLQIFGLSEPFSDPTDIAILSGNRLVITDAGDNRVIICKIVYSRQ
jgi:sugar lactone lactonase YvrE